MMNEKKLRNNFEMVELNDNELDQVAGGRTHLCQSGCRALDNLKKLWDLIFG